MNTYFLQQLRNSAEDNSRNIEPIEPYDNIGLPGVRCDECGQTWATSSQHISKDLPKDHYLWSRRQWPVAPDELNRIANDVRETLLLGDQALIPGTRVSILRFRQKKKTLAALAWPLVNTLIISDEVKRFWETQGFTGWVAEPTIIVNTISNGEEVVLHEVNVTGKGGTPKTYPLVAIVFHCDVCGRTEYNLDYTKLNPNHFELDTENWDGSDVFRFDPPFEGRIAVSERFKATMEASQFDGFELPSLQQEILRVVENSRLLNPNGRKR